MCVALRVAGRALFRTVIGSKPAAMSASTASCPHQSASTLVAHLSLGSINAVCSSVTYPSLDGSTSFNSFPFDAPATVTPSAGASAPLDHPSLHCLQGRQLLNSQMVPCRLGSEIQHVFHIQHNCKRQKFYTNRKRLLFDRKFTPICIRCFGPPFHGVNNPFPFKTSFQIFRQRGWCASHR